MSADRSVIAGIHAVKHALDAGDPIDELLIEKGKRHPRINELIHLAKKSGIRFSFVPKQALIRLAESVPHQGVVAKMATAGAMQMVSFEDWLKALNMDKSPLVLLLDQVTDPHNLGAVLRCADAAGADAVVEVLGHVELAVPDDGRPGIEVVIPATEFGLLVIVPIEQNDFVGIARNVDKQDRGAAFNSHDFNRHVFDGLGFAPGLEHGNRCIHVTVLLPVRVEVW